MALLDCSAEHKENGLRAKEPVAHVIIIKMNKEGIPMPGLS